MRVLIVDDHTPARRTLVRCLAPLDGLEIQEVASLVAARQTLARQVVDVALIDLRLDESDPHNRDGLTLVRELREQTAIVPIVVTVSSAMAEIRDAMRSGAYAYILKDELCEELVVPVLSELRRRRALEREVLHLHGLVGTSPPMEKLCRMLKKVAAVDAPVLIQGPTGSGKELAARAIHALSSRREQPLVTVNCGAFTESLVEAQLFGYEKGFFTGADKAREGYLSEVRRGTLFLDEIAELPPPLQTKLLRVLENRTYRVLGASRDNQFEGRIVAATHVDLKARVKAKQFREDLYYRLEVLTVRIPALDERKEDIPALVEHLAKELHRSVRFSPDGLEALAQMRWPGNIRQLRNLIQRLAVFSESELITAADLESYSTAKSVPELGAPVPAALGRDLLEGVSLRQSRNQNTLLLSRNQIRLLEAEGVPVEEICQIMGIGRATFFRLKSGKDAAADESAASTTVKSTD
jgi:DNA-binding NtrC family response regulator